MYEKLEIDYNDVEKTFFIHKKEFNPEHEMQISNVIIFVDEENNIVGVKILNSSGNTVNIKRAKREMHEKKKS